MTSYLSNPDQRPTGFEPAEFIEVPPVPDQVTSEAWPPSARREATIGHLDPQTRLNITGWAHEYITALVENHDGDRQDVRSIIHDLYHESTLANYDRSA